MDHLSKFYLNQTVNETKNVVSRKLRKPKKWWRLAPRNQEPDIFFMKRTPARIAWRQLFTARWFLIETQKLGCFNMSCQATVHAPPGVAYNSGKILDCFASA